MLNVKKQKSELRKRYVFEIAQKLFRRDVDNLSAQYILLGSSVNADMNIFKERLEESKSLGYTFDREDMDGVFIQNGEFVSHVKDQAEEVLFENLTWTFAHNPDGEPEFSKVNLQPFRKMFHEILTLPLGEEGKSLDSCEFVSKEILSCQKETLKQIMAEEVETGDSVLHLIYPNYNHPKLHYKIDISVCSPSFKKLVERRGDDVVYIGKSIASDEFAAAFFESLDIKPVEHKNAILRRLNVFKAH